MGRGKYSPSCPHANKGYDYKYNCYGEIAVEYNGDQSTYDEKIHFDNYDDEGFDSYGYSAFDSDGNYCGIGDGVDRFGCTESDYSCMSDEEWEHTYYRGDPVPTNFERKRQ